MFATYFETLDVYKKIIEGVGKTIAENNAVNGSIVLLARTAVSPNHTVHNTCGDGRHCCFLSPPANGLAEDNFGIIAARHKYPHGHKVTRAL